MEVWAVAELDEPPTALAVHRDVVVAAVGGFLVRFHLPDFYAQAEQKRAIESDRVAVAGLFGQRSRVNASGVWFTSNGTVVVVRAQARLALVHVRSFELIQLAPASVVATHVCVGQDGRVCVAHGTRVSLFSLPDLAAPYDEFVLGEKVHAVGWVGEAVAVVFAKWYAALDQETGTARRLVRMNTAVEPFVASLPSDEVLLRVAGTDYAFVDEMGNATRTHITWPQANSPALAVAVAFPRVFGVGSAGGSLEVYHMFETCFESFALPASREVRVVSDGSVVVVATDNQLHSCFVKDEAHQSNTQFVYQLATQEISQRARRDSDKLRESVATFVRQLLQSPSHPLGNMVIETSLTFNAQYHVEAASDTDSEWDEPVQRGRSTSGVRVLGVVSVPDVGLVLEQQLSALSRAVQSQSYVKAITSLRPTIATNASAANRSAPISSPPPLHSECAGNHEHVELQDVLRPSKAEEAALGIPKSDEHKARLEREREEARLQKAQRLQKRLRRRDARVAAAVERLREAVDDVRAATTRVVHAAEFLYPPLARSRFATVCVRTVQEEILSSVHEELFALYRQAHEVADGRLRALQSAGSVTVADMGVAAQFDIGLPAFAPVMESLTQISQCVNPGDKTRCLVDAERAVWSCIANHHAGPPHVRQSGDDGNEGDDDKGAASAHLDPNLTMGADELLPVFCYLLAHANTPALHAECALMCDFVSDRLAMGEEGYALATLQTALLALVPRETNEGDKQAPQAGKEASQSWAEKVRVLGQRIRVLGGEVLESVGRQLSAERQARSDDEEEAAQAAQAARENNVAAGKQGRQQGVAGPGQAVQAQEQEGDGAGAEGKEKEKDEDEGERDDGEQQRPSNKHDDEASPEQEGGEQQPASPTPTPAPAPAPETPPRGTSLLASLRGVQQALGSRHDEIQRTCLRAFALPWDTTLVDYFSCSNTRGLRGTLFVLSTHVCFEVYPMLLTSAKEVLPLRSVVRVFKVRLMLVDASLCFELRDGSKHTFGHVLGRAEAIEAIVGAAAALGHHIDVLQR